MTCKTIQRRLLGAEHPGRPGADIQAHLDACTRCRDWQARLVHLEQNVAHLPVPASTRRHDFLAQMAEGAFDRASAPAAQPAAAGSAIEAAERATIPIVRPSVNHLHPQRLTPQQVFGLAVTAAAAALLLAVVSWSLRDDDRPLAVANTGKPKKDMLVTSLVQKHLVLATAKTKPQRAKALEEIAHELDSESQALPDNAQDLINAFSQLKQNIADALRGLDSTYRTWDKKTVLAADAGRVQSLERNRKLIQSIVASAIRLAQSEDPLKRADDCRDLVQTLVSEIAVAFRGNDGSRANEMSENLHDVLAKGVAKTLRDVQRPRGSAFDLEIRRVVDWVASDTKSLEDELNGEANMKVALEWVRSGRVAVEKVRAS